MQRALGWSNHVQSPLHAHSYHQSAHIPIQSLEMEHKRSQNASLPNHLLQSTQAFQNMVHIGTSQAHQVIQNACIPSGKEHYLPSQSLSQVTIDHATKRLQNSIKEHVVQDPPSPKATNMLPSPTSQTPIATAHQGQVCITIDQENSLTQSATHSEPPGKGEVSKFVFSATKLQEESSLGQEQKGLHSNVK